MVFNYEWLPEPKWMKSPRTVYVLFAVIYLFLITLNVVFFFTHLNVTFTEFDPGERKKTNLLFNENWAKEWYNTMKKALYSWTGMVFLIHFLGAILTVYGIFFVLRDSIRLRYGYPSHHPRSNGQPEATGNTNPPEVSNTQYATAGISPAPSCPVPGPQTLRALQNPPEIGFRLPDGASGSAPPPYPVLQQPKQTILVYQ